MAIEKMLLLNLVGSRDEEKAILQQLVLCENVHVNLEHSDISENHYLIREYETLMPRGNRKEEAGHLQAEGNNNELENTALQVAADLDIKLRFEKKNIKFYSINDAAEDLRQIKDKIEPIVETIKRKRLRIKEIEFFRETLKSIYLKVDLNELKELNYFNYEIGMLSRDNKIHIKKNYENINAIVKQIGDIEDSKEDIYLVLYLTQFEEEASRILKSLNWHKLHIPEGIIGNVQKMTEMIDEEILGLKQDIERLEKSVLENKEEVILRLNKIYTRIKLEQKTHDLRAQLIQGNNVFLFNGWIRRKDKNKVEKMVADVTDKYVLVTKTPEEVEEEMTPPTLLKNNWFFKPFEEIVKLYGLPSYNEIDPTAFLAVTFCLMFGIMFGDIGQGLVYFLAGLIMHKKNELAGGVLTRLGLSSILFGFVYGSVFGIEEVPILAKLALVQGGPLRQSNIMPILLTGVLFGVVVLTVCFGIGIINALRRGDVEQGVFGKNGIIGYLFFMGLILTAAAIIKAVPVSVIIPISMMIISLIIMVFKEPLTHLVEGKRPLIKGDKSSYYVESIFEGIETLLSTLSNAISFIRVGAFALNHAGLFLAFKVMSEMTPNILLKLIILTLGNVLILTLEGLVVFIQGLRLQYYEMFSKYFSGDGSAYSPVTIQNNSIYLDN